MKKLYPFFCIILCVLAGCSSTTVLPEKDGAYSVIANSDSENYAYNQAMQRAAKVCQDQGQQVQVIRHQSVYQGIPKAQKGMLDLADSVVQIAAESQHHKRRGDTGVVTPSTSSDNDYRVTLKFRCV